MSFVLSDIESQDNPYNMVIGKPIYQHKEFSIEAQGGAIIPFPPPTPLSFTFWGQEHMEFKEGDLIMVPRNTNNNPKVRYLPNQKHPLILEAKYFNEELIGEVERIEVISTKGLDLKGLIYHRMHLKGPLKNKYHEVCHPMPGGGVARIAGYDRGFYDQRLGEKVEKAKKLHGSKWKEKSEGGIWKKWSTHGLNK